MKKQTNFIDSACDEFYENIENLANSVSNLAAVSRDINYSTVGDYLAIIQNKLTLLKKDYKSLSGKLK